jgi:S-adenosylmethionine:tRNA ribosyltransferase-isomerase
VSFLTTDLFDYTLPAHLIAQKPAARRDQSRLLVVDRAKHSIAHHTFADLPQFLEPGDTLIRNNASVLPARLFARRSSGGHVECFLLSMTDKTNVWRCLIKPGKKLPVGAVFAHSSGAFQGEVVSKADDGSAFVRFTTAKGEPITVVANRIGQVPLPPYISRERTTTAAAESTSGPTSERAGDIERYQTVYADPARQVAVAAPTAGLHFTPELLQQIAAKGVETADVTLHVGLGTFQPITAERIENHAIHREIYEMPHSTQRVLFPPYKGRRIAIGTTTVRTLEDFLTTHDRPIDGGQAHVAEASIFIYPARNFRGVDALVTNFHQPRSTLLCLVAAFLAPGSLSGIEWLREIYAEAIAKEYRFFSYGDAMLIL